MLGRIGWKRPWAKAKQVSNCQPNSLLLWQTSTQYAAQYMLLGSICYGYPRSHQQNCVVKTLLHQITKAQIFSGQFRVNSNILLLVLHCK